VLNGDRGPRRDIGVLNAAAALVIAGNAVDLSEGVAQASASVDSGRAAEVLDELVRVSSISALDAEVG
jgi:anthranilate phosphoribosyltransferase